MSRNTDTPTPVCGAIEDQGSSSQGATIPTAQTDGPAGLLADIVASDWTDEDLARLRVNVLYARGSLSKEVRSDVSQAIGTLRAIFADARRLAAPRAAEQVGTQSQGDGVDQ